MKKDEIYLAVIYDSTIMEHAHEAMQKYNSDRDKQSDVKLEKK